MTINPTGARLAPEECYGRGTLPLGIRSRMMCGVNGLDIHVLEAGFDAPARPIVLLLHGFPEISYSWRRIMLPLADAGYHVVAPDMRGHGRTTGWYSAFEADEVPFRLSNLVRDAVALVYAIGQRSVAAVLGHDAGSPVAAWAALMRPDVFRSVVLLSTPFPGAPRLPIGTTQAAAPPPPSILSVEMDAMLAALDPPRQHYVHWYATRGANSDMMDAPQGLHAFFRAYYHSKSADYGGNMPHRLSSASAGALAEIPDYYIMPRGCGMAETVARFLPTASQIATCRWLPDNELAVYVEEYGRTGFAGGLWAYRRATGAVQDPERLTHANRLIEVPACFISGASDWGTWQAPGALEAMETQACREFHGVHLVDGAGHWVQQEQPDAVVKLTLRFLDGTDAC